MTNLILPDIFILMNYTSYNLSLKKVNVGTSHEMISVICFSAENPILWKLVKVPSAV